jgi:hypothetical protein
MLVISFGYYDSIKVDEKAILSWFPTLLTSRSFNIDGDQLTDTIDDRIASYTQTSITSSTIRHSLKQFFDAFRPFHNISHTSWLKQKLERLLNTDIHGPQVSGCKSIRQTFLILACLARTTASAKLADALATWLSNFDNLVVQYETPHHLREWGFAICELRGLAYEPTLQQLLACVMPSMPAYNSWPRKVMADAAYEQWNRRRPKLIAAPDRWVPRARSAPGYRCPVVRVRSPELRLGWPVNRWPRSAWPSPVIPARVPDHSDNEEYEALQLEQDLQALEVDELHRRVMRLEGSNY